MPKSRRRHDRRLTPNIRKSPDQDSRRWCFEPLELRRLLSITFTPLYDFTSNAPDPNQPQDSLTADAQGNLYGCSYTGGQYGLGTLFELPAGSGTPITLHSFQDNGVDGVHPESKVAIDPEGNLFGFTDGGGSDTFGTVWEMPHGSSSLNILYNFTGAGDGFTPLGQPCLDAAGNIYGVSFNGGLYSHGSIFEIAADTHQKTDLYDFGTTASDGENPDTVIIDSAGDLFGTARNGGQYGSGNVFELPAGSHTLDVLYSFNPQMGDGSLPYFGVDFDPFGNLWGTLSSGGAQNEGAVFELTKTPSGYNPAVMVASFPSSGPDGINPYADVTFDAQGNLFGAAANGGTHSQGAVFEIPVGTNTIVPIYSFASGQGNSPHGAPTITPSGNLFGTTYLGGLHNLGEIYEISGAVSPGNASLVTLNSGGLDVSGTSAADNITVSSANSNLSVSINGFPNATYPLSSLTSINVNGNAGNDTITIASSVPATLGVSVQGGPGDDTIQGGPGNDALGGGQGNDFILGGPGDDLIHGGAGDDSIGGGQGDDQLYGGLGNDTMTGGAGNDTLVGGAGNNVLHGGLGDDNLFAINSAADTLYGGAGNDTAHIDQGLDQIPNNDIETVLFT